MTKKNGGVTVMPAGHATILANFGRPKKWADKNLMGAAQRESIPSAKTWRYWWTQCPQRSLTVSWVALSKSLAAGKGKWSSPSTQYWWCFTWSSVSTSELLSTREIWIYRRKFSIGQKNMIKEWGYFTYEKKKRQRTRTLQLGELSIS